MVITNPVARRFHAAVVKWFGVNARDLPWRKTSDPYRIWISEIMLQQTTVATVIPYYERFVAAFPSVEKLAAASEDEVIKLWEGLGYYRRARHMRAAADMVVKHFGGEFPQSRDELLQLPGIGDYSAGAILSIAFRRATPALDGNLIRVYSRFLGIREAVDDGSVLKSLWFVAGQMAEQSHDSSRAFCEGMMELGALICRPQNPICADCPLAWGCRAKKYRWIHEIPLKARLKKRRLAYEQVFWYRRGDQIALLKKGSDPRYPHFYRLPFKSLDRAPERKSDYRYAITETDYRVWLERRRVKGKAENPKRYTPLLEFRNEAIQWHPLNTLPDLSFPAIDRKIVLAESRRAIIPQ